MELKQLKCFYEACKYQSFTKAAEHLFMTQQGISKTIRQLELELNVTLFCRTACGVSLTPAGEYLKSRCEILLIGLDETVNRLREMQTQSSLSLGLTLGMHLVLAEDLTEQFQRLYPNLSLHITEGPDLQCEQDVLAGRTDLAITISLVDETLFQVTPLFSEPVCIVANRENPISQKEKVSFDDLRGQKLILLDEKNRSYGNIIRKCCSYGFTPDIAFKVPDIVSAFELCQANKGATLTLLCLKERLIYDRVCFLPLDGSGSWDICLISRKEKQDTPEMTAFRNYIASRLSGKTLSNGALME